MFVFLFVCLFVYVDARAYRLILQPPEEGILFFRDVAYIQNNFNVFYTDQMVGWVDKEGRERVGKKAGIEPLPPNPTPKMADPKQYLT